jgi:hypothetical protein
VLDDLTDEDVLAVLNLVADTIEADRCPRLLKKIIAKYGYGEMGPVPSELTQKLRRYAPPPPVRRPMPEERDPSRAPRQGQRPRR